MDTTTFVFGLQPPAQATQRRFKNWSLAGKVVGAVALSLAICLAIMSWSFRRTFQHVERQLIDDGEVQCLQRCDIELSVLQGLVDDRLRDISAGVGALAHSLRNAPTAVATPRDLESLLEDRLRSMVDRLSFFCMVDASRRIMASYIVHHAGGTHRLQRHTPGDRATMPAGGLFDEVRGTDELVGTMVLDVGVLQRLGLAESVKISIRTSQADESLFDERCLALAVLRPCPIGGRGYTLFAGFVVNNDAFLVESVQRLLFLVRRRSDGHDRATETALSFCLGRTCVATTAIGADGRSLIGELVDLPSSRLGEGSQAVWRGRCAIGGRTFIGSYAPLVDVRSGAVGYLGAAIEVDSFMAPRRAEVARLHADANRCLVVTVVVAVLLSLTVGILAARQLIWPLALLTKATEQVAEGNLAVDVTLDGDDEIGLLASGFRNMIRNLRALTHRVEDATVRLGDAAAHLRDNLGSQSAMSAQQSVAVNETTATLEELAASSRQIADSALAVVKVAAKTLQSAKRGVESSQSTIGQMDRIRQANAGDLRRIADLSARVARIDEIMTLINTIADQTKLIAFNAAIEAAAAGDAGRRFSVVSEEIRRLAESVQDRATEIRRAIADVQVAADELVASRREGTTVVEEGADMTGRTSADLQDIHDDSQSVLQESKQISLSTQQQRSATEQTLTALREISQGVTELAAGARHTEDVVERLFNLAAELRESVERFRLVDEAVPPSETEGHA